MDKLELDLLNDFLKESLSKNEYIISKIILEGKEGINVINVIEKTLGMDHQKAFREHQFVIEKLKEILLSDKAIEYNSYISLKYILAMEICPSSKYTLEKFVEYLKDIEEYVCFFLVEIFYLVLYKRYDSQNILEMNQKIRNYRKIKREIEISNRTYTHKLKSIMNSAVKSKKKEKKRFEVEKILRSSKEAFDFIDKKNRSIESYFSTKLKAEVRCDDKDKYELLKSLEYSNEIIAYLPSPISIEYSYKNNKQHFKSDLLVILKDKSGILIHINDYKEMGMYENICKWMSLKNYCNEHGLAYLITDGKKSIEYYQNYNKNIEFEKEILNKLDSGKITWVEYKKIKNFYKVDSKNLISVILKHQVIYNKKPFLLRGSWS